MFKYIQESKFTSSPQLGEGEQSMIYELSIGEPKSPIGPIFCESHSHKEYNKHAFYGRGARGIT